MAATPDDNDSETPSLVNQYVTENGSTVQTRESDDGTVKEKCPSCGNWYERISGHWAMSSCQHPSISQQKWEMCKGLMMGDGNIGNRSGKNCTIEINNTNLTFLEYLQHQFDWLSTILYKTETAQEAANRLSNGKQEMSSSVTNSEDYYDGYKIHTRSHSLFNEFEKWWTTGEKVFPYLNYTKPLLRMWWVSDGSFNWRHGNSSVRFASWKEGCRPENIINSFSDIGFDCSMYGGTDFILPVDQTEDFFDYIGHDPVPGFEYKWAWQDRDRYKRLKKESKEKHCTQTIE